MFGYTVHQSSWFLQPSYLLKENGCRDSDTALTMSAGHVCNRLFLMSCCRVTVEDRLCASILQGAGLCLV